MPIDPTKPVVILHPPDGTIIEGLTLKCDPPGSQGYGVYCNGTKNLTIRNCRIEGFNFGIGLTGGNPGFQIYGNTIVNCTSPAGKDSSGIYTEGACGGASIHDNVILNTGWWPEYDPSDPAQRAAANRHHGGWYDNESYGTDDNVAFYDNIVLDGAGSQCLMRHGGVCLGNVFRCGGDFDVIAASLGGNGFVVGNAHFGPRKDAVPYYGGGIRRYGNMLCRDNLFAGSASTTNNPTCYDNATNTVIPQCGWWPKAGARPVPSTPVPTLEDWCKLTYGVPDVAKLQPGDAPKIVSWLRGLILTPPPQVIMQPAPVPAPSEVVLSVDWAKQKVQVK